MKITFLISTVEHRLTLIQHDTGSIERASFMNKTQINVEREWARFLDARPDIRERLIPADRPWEEPSLVGAIEGAVTWYEGLEQEPWEEEIVA
jgi:hypothetical protein